jgi:hypothetical protein
LANITHPQNSLSKSILAIDNERSGQVLKTRTHR